MAEVEYTAGMVDTRCGDDGGKGGYKFSEEVNVGLEGVLDHESVDLEKCCLGVPSLEEKDALLLCWTPYPCPLVHGAGAFIALSKKRGMIIPLELRLLISFFFSPWLLVC